ncbi:MAG: STAS domain-containing protein [Solirubrobacteraceae bacterium]
MPQTSLETMLRISSEGPVIELHGEIDSSAKDALAVAYEEAPHDGRLLLDFSAVDYINSTGIALIVGLLARARAERRPVAARGLSDHYRQIFEITRISDFMTILVDNASTDQPAQEGTR